MTWLFEALKRFVEPPEDPHPEELWKEKVEAVWQFVYHHMATGAAGGPGAPQELRSALAKVHSAGTQAAMGRAKNL